MSLDEFFGWIQQNLYWLIPSLISATLLTINIFYYKSTRKQQLTQISIGLMKERYSVYLAFHDCITKILNFKTIKTDDMAEFCNKANMTHFLFGKDIINEYEKFRRMLMDYYILIREEQSLYQNGDKSYIDKTIGSINEKKRDQEKQFSEYDDYLIMCFKAYLDFSNYKVNGEITK